MAGDLDHPTPTATEPEASATPRALAPGLGGSKIFGVMLQAAYDPCTCRSCVVLRELGREIAGALAPGSPEEPTP